MTPPCISHVLRAGDAVAAVGLPIILFATLALVGIAGASPDQADDCDHQLRRLCCGEQNLILVSGCTPKQRIPLILGPGEHQVFVDGNQIVQVQADLRLRADRDHTVFIQREGYRPELVVLRSEGEKGSEQLRPSRIELELARRASIASRGLDIEQVEEAVRNETDAERPAASQASASEDPPKVSTSPTEPPANQAEGELGR